MISAGVAKSAGFAGNPAAVFAHNAFTETTPTTFSRLPRYTGKWERPLATSARQVTSDSSSALIQTIFTLGVISSSTRNSSKRKTRSTIPCSVELNTPARFPCSNRYRSSSSLTGMVSVLSFTPKSAAKVFVVPLSNCTIGPNPRATA